MRCEEFADHILNITSSNSLTAGRVFIFHKRQVCCKMHTVSGKGCRSLHLDSADALRRCQRTCALSPPREDIVLELHGAARNLVADTAFRVRRPTHPEIRFTLGLYPRQLPLDPSVKSSYLLLPAKAYIAKVDAPGLRPCLRFVDFVTISTTVFHASE